MTQQIHELFVHAPPARVFQAIVDGEQSRQYFFGSAFTGKLEEGAAYRYAFPDGSVAVDGQVLAVDPGRRLELSWSVHYDPRCAGERSKVRYEVSGMGELTKLTVTHELTGAPHTAENVGTNGWSLVLCGLKTLLETGRPLPLPDFSGAA